ncbi:MAG: carboxypeptidase-like regulatory domain-containing protein [Candidatus Acidiferrales bacterium]
MRASSRYGRLAYSVLGLAVVVVLASGVLSGAVWAQSTSTGTIIGSVVDNSNAAVPGATVTITLKTTGATRTTTTDDAGRYVFADVDPGNYDISVSKTGFSTTVISSQVVQIGLQLTANAKLQVGAVSTTVTVTETPGSELQTLTPTVGTTLSGAVILNLPNTSRDASTLAVLQPGQNINGATGGEVTDQNSFQLDGGYATDDMSGDNNTYIKAFGSDTAGGSGAMHSAGFSQAPSAVVPIPVASISEFKVSTSNQTADFNGGAGSQVQLTTKRGTKTLHGSVYEYYLDDNFGGANTWDNNSTGTAQPSSHFSRFGAAAGGEIPKVNFLGGGWYLFGNYEGFRYPESSEFEEDFPLPSLRAGILHILQGTTPYTINLNPFPVTDPGCGSAPSCRLAADGFTTAGTSVPTTMCPAGPCDPRGLGTTMNGTPTGTPNPVMALWSASVPLPNDCSQGDGLNYCGYKGSISTPQSSNFGVVRLDHDFAQNWHFNATYHYYRLSNTVDNQIDVGGFFPGDTLGQYAAIRQKPQEPWIYTAGLTTNVSSNVTNDFHFSFTRNWWAYGDPGGIPNVAGFPAALEVGGEQQDTFQPYNTNNQDVRTRYWNGHDSMYRDDVTWIKGNHLFQLGGLYQHNNDTHNRNDNGETINTFEQYLVGAGNGASLAGYGIDMTGYIPTGITGGNADKYGNLYSMVLGMVDETQSLYTRSPGSLETGLPLNTRTSCAIPGIAATAACISSPPLTNDSIIPTYNGYFTDAWHIKPTFSLNYGLGYTVEMPPFNTNGGYQTVMVDQNNHILYAENYLNSVKAAALQGNAYAPLIGFSIVDNVQDHSKYPYDPYFGGLSPRVGFAWNLRPDTVIRGGYSRIFGRINGVNPILVPMLTPGLMQPATCGGPTISGQCGVGPGATGLATPANVFRVGVDGVNAPLPPPSADLPQPWYPGFNDVATGAGETIDPNYHPDRSDEFTLSIQHQFGPKILAEVGYIGRIIGNMGQYYSLTAVPYMMTRGGQSFANAWANVMVATNYGTNLTNIPVQPFFENALTPAYCNIGSGTGQFSSCTAAFVNNNAGLMNVSDAFDAWGGVSNAGGFAFGRSFTSDPIAATCVGGVGNGCSGQSPSILTTVSNGYGNYNAGYLQLSTTNWHGLTAHTNFQYSNALGTGAVVQATSSFATVDPWNLQNAYGPQSYNEKFVFNLFLNYAEPFFTSQQGIVGHLLGGWNFAPNFVYGSGFPIELGTANFDCGSFGECNTNYVGAQENGIIVQNLRYSGTEKPGYGTVCGTGGAGYNVFSNPDATCAADAEGIFGDPVRSPILGYDGQIGGGGPLKGLPFWNLDMGITKNIKIKERLSGSLYFDFTNVLNHMQPNDPSLNIYDPTDWGVLGGGGPLQGNTPRQLQLGLSFDW